MGRDLLYRRGTRRWAKHLDFMLWDVVCLQLALVVAYIIRNGHGLPYQDPMYRSLSVIYIILDLLVAVAFNTMHNVLKRGYYQEVAQTAKQVSLVLLSMLLYMFAIQTSDFYSRIIIFLTASLHFVFGYLVRIGWKKFLLSRDVGRSNTTMILVAAEDVAETMINDVASTNTSFAGVVVIDRDAMGEAIAGIPVVANLKDAAEYLRQEWVDEVYVCPRDFADLPSSKDEGGETAQRNAVAELIELCSLMAVPVHIRLPLGGLNEKGFAEKIAGHTVITFVYNYASGLQLALKRLLDIIGGLVGSVVAVLIILVVGPFIMVASPGPVLFAQTRIGLNGKKFRMYKLRSMYMDAEERKAELMAQNRVQDGMMFKLDWDPRIIGNRIVDGKKKTGIGEFIRRTSLDEFPQFFNVLLGQMSLVGTRPPTVDEWEKYEYHHRARLATKPGITGLWQVSGRSNITDFEEVVRLDTEYIQNWSMGLDLRILAKTVKVVFAGHGAM